MNSATITMSGLLALEDALAAATYTVHRTRLDATAGNVGPDDAADAIDAVRGNVAAAFGVRDLNAMIDQAMATAARLNAICDRIEAREVES